MALQTISISDQPAVFGAKSYGLPGRSDGLKAKPAAFFSEKVLLESTVAISFLQENSHLTLSDSSFFEFFIGKFVKAQILRKSPSFRKVEKSR